MRLRRVLPTEAEPIPGFALDRSLPGELDERSVISYAKEDDPAELNRAALYVLVNDHTDLIGAPRDRFPHRKNELGGGRLAL